MSLPFETDHWLVLGAVVLVLSVGATFVLGGALSADWDKDKSGSVDCGEVVLGLWPPAVVLLILGGLALYVQAKARHAWSRLHVLHDKAESFGDDLRTHGGGGLLDYVEQELSRDSSRKKSASRRWSSDPTAAQSASTLDLRMVVDEHEMLSMIQDSPCLRDLCDELQPWNYDIFDLAAMTEHPLVVTGFACLDALEVPFDKLRLTSFLVDLESNYKDVPYHNCLHGATVARSGFSMCKSLGVGRRGSHSELLRFSLVFSGLIHDVGHPGLTAPFLAKVGDELSLRYSDESPLEHMHLAVAFSLLRKEKNSFLSDDILSQIKHPIVKAVLGTDMARHSEQNQRLLALMDNLKHGGAEGCIAWYWPAKPPPTCATAGDVLDWENGALTDFVLELFLHACDIGSATMPFDQFQRWNSMVQQEFHAQGDREREQFGALISAADGYDRHVDAARLQRFTCGFVKFLVQPFYSKLEELSNIRSDRNIVACVDLSPCMRNLAVTIASLERDPSDG